MAIHCLIVSLGEVVSGAEAHQCVDPLVYLHVYVCMCLILSMGVFQYSVGSVSYTHLTLPTNREV